MKSKFAICLFLCCLLVGCKQKYLGVDQMKVLMWDLSKVEAFHANQLKLKFGNKADSVAAEKYAQVFLLHKTTPSAFYSSFENYRKNPKLFNQLLDSLNSFAVRQRDQQYSDKYKPKANAVQ